MEVPGRLEQLTEQIRAAAEKRLAAVAAERAANGGKLKKRQDQEKACISYWHGRLLQTPVPMPVTKILRPDVDLYELCSIWDGAQCPPETMGKFERLAGDIEFQCGRVGYPAFLRTGTTSGKHDWKDTCLITEKTSVRRNLANLIQDAVMKSQCVDVFAVRELLPTKPVFHAFHGQMPIVKERRFFVRDGKILGDVPYWPAEAFENQEVSAENWRELLEGITHLTPDERAYLTDATLKAAWVLSGEWSIDWLLTRRGWYLTDCAPARMSYGWGLLPAEVRGV